MKERQLVVLGIGVKPVFNGGHNAAIMQPKNAAKRRGHVLFTPGKYTMPHYIFLFSIKKLKYFIVFSVRRGELQELQ